MRGFKRAVELAGGYRGMAEALKVHPRSVRDWVKRGGIPLRYVKKIERLYGVPIQGNALDHGGLQLFREALDKDMSVDFVRRKIGASKETLERWKKQERIPKAAEEKIKDVIYGIHRRYKGAYSDSKKSVDT